MHNLSFLIFQNKHRTQKYQKMPKKYHSHLNKMRLTKILVKCSYILVKIQIIIDLIRVQKHFYTIISLFLVIIEIA